MYVEKLEKIANTTTVEAAPKLLQDMINFIRETAKHDPNRDRQYAAQDLADAMDEALAGLEIKQVITKFQGLGFNLNAKMNFSHLVPAIRRQFAILADLDR
jgi:hypothetical protein